MTKLANEIKASEEERLASLNEVEKFKKSYAKYMITDKDKIKDYIEHPYVPTKKDIRKKKRHEFFNKLKKAIGL